MACAVHRDRKVTLRPHPSPGYSLPAELTSAGYEFWPSPKTLSFPASRLFVVEYVSDGQASYTQDGETTIVGPGHAYCFTKGTDHLYSTGPTGYLSTRYVGLDGPLLDLLLRYLSLWGVCLVAQPRGLEPLMRRAYRLLSGPSDPETTLQASSLAYDILLCLSSAIRPRHHAAVERCLDLMSRSLHLRMDMRGICAELGVSTTHLRRLFRRELACSPMEYFLSQKLTWAASMLLHTNRTVKDVAAAAGYDNQLYFSNQFKRRFGVSPRAYRESPPT